MAKYTNGIMGPASGSVGSLVACTWKGINYLRSKPRKTNKKRTPARLANEALFGYRNKFLLKLNEFVKIGLAHYKPTNTATMAAASLNKHVVNGTAPDFLIDYPAVILSYGPLPGARDYEVTAFEPKSVSINWNPSAAEPGTSPHDLVMVMTWCENLQVAEYDLAAGKRKDGSATLSLPSAYSGKKIVVWIAFTSIDRKTVSMSEYLGEVDVL